MSASITCTHTMSHWLTGSLGSSSGGKFRDQNLISLDKQGQNVITL